jgi:PAS domain S-box-containing protein
MEAILSKQSPSIRIFQIIVYGLVISLWLKIAVEISLALVVPASTLPLINFTLNLVLTMVFTISLFFFYRKFQAHLEEQVREYIKLFNKNPYPMWVYDLDTLRFLKVNDAAISLYGYCEEEFLKMTIKDIRPLEDVPAVISLTERIKLTFNQEYHWSGTWRHNKRSGESMYVEISSHEILFDGKKAELVLAYDVTDKIHQEQKLQALNQDLERKVMVRTNDQLQLNKRLIDQNKIIKSANLELSTLSNQLQEANKHIQEHADLKNKFMSMASHEFRTPLANIKFSAGMISRYYEKLDKDNVLSKVQGIEAQVNHMTALLDDLLTIGKDDAVKLTASVGQVDLHKFVSIIINEVHNATLGTHDIKLSISENVSPWINTDEKFLRNIFINLLTNAIKYSPGQNEVYLSIHGNGNEIYIDIKDKGLGISEDDIKKIFEPFYRTLSVEHIKGTGLGLSIVKRAVDLLNAKIEVASEIGQGSTFRVILPVV